MDQIRLMNPNPNDLIRALIESWCERKEYRPLAIILPCWTANNGLTDGWGELHDALKHAYVMCNDLPPGERENLKLAYVAIELALRAR